MCACLGVCAGREECHELLKEEAQSRGQRKGSKGPRGPWRTSADVIAGLRPPGALTLRIRLTRVPGPIPRNQNVFHDWMQRATLMRVEDPYLQRFHQVRVEIVGVTWVVCVCVFAAPGTRARSSSIDQRAASPAVHTAADTPLGPLLCNSWQEKRATARPYSLPASTCPAAPPFQCQNLLRLCELVVLSGHVKTILVKTKRSESAHEARWAPARPGVVLWCGSAVLLPDPALAPTLESKTNGLKSCRRRSRAAAHA